MHRDESGCSRCSQSTRSSCDFIESHCEGVLSLVVGVLSLVVVGVLSLLVVGVVSLGVGVLSLVVVGVVRLVEVTTAAEGRVPDLQKFFVFEVAPLFQPAMGIEIRNDYIFLMLKIVFGLGGGERFL